MNSDILVAVIGLIGALFAAGIAAWATLKNKKEKNIKSPTEIDNSTANGISKNKIFFGLTLVARDDISWRMGEEIGNLPKETIPEAKLFYFAEKVFRHPAFYNHPERHWPGSLYAFIVTRLVWEQEVMCRISASKLESANEVLSALLEIENFVATTVGLAPDELTMLTQKFIKDKEQFLDNWYRHPKISLEAYRKRSELLEQLQSALQELGLNISGVGRNVVSDGGE